MNPQTNAPAPAPAPVQTALLSTKPPFIQSLLHMLMAVGAIVTLLLGLAAYADILPKDYAVYIGVATGLLLALQRFIIAVGDILDDGVANDSFKLGILALLILPLAVASCATRTDGVTTFLSLDAGQWSAVGLAAGKGALQGGLPEYLQQRQPPPPALPVSGK